MLKIFLRSRLLFFSLILLFGFLGFVLAIFLGRQNYDDKTLQQAQIHREQTGSVLAEIPQEGNQQEEPKDSFGDILVTRVIDGDTIEIEGGQRVRYIGIDTPETSHPQKGVECFGREASAENRKLVEGKKVVLEKDVSEIDKYGRLLRYVYARDTFVNQYLVIQGYAHSSSYPRILNIRTCSLKQKKKLGKIIEACGADARVTNSLLIARSRATFPQAARKYTTCPAKNTTTKLSLMN